MPTTVRVLLQVDVKRMSLEFQNVVYVATLEIPSKLYVPSHFLLTLTHLRFSPLVYQLAF